ncbi:aldo/keto reductase [Chitinophaga sp. XS-30]|uniref:aldo/keto reductase n=1 Tax=Chitinophaga sp. XS-30 TaxID=2604421 RepID=UPI0011DCEC9B|nr:aldo/keto reductase [Chitinophaga sp. XS-30]QEH39606.1 aldo/keto reductase [Chitinophaga sp. XS-30]
MEKRSLGNTGLEIAPLMFGGNVFGWTADEEMSYRLLDEFTDAGFNAIDTADTYTAWVPGNTGGDSERLIGKWLQRTGKRDQVVIATKVGGKFSEEKKGLKKEYILSQVEDSLQRLQTDYIDLYQSHYDDPETPIEETLEAFTILVKSGKVRAIGASNITVDRLADSIITSEDNDFATYQTLQPEYNLFDRERYEQEFEQFALINKIAVIPYFSLASGFLTGKYRAKADIAGSSREKYLDKYFTERGFKILNALENVAAQYDSKPAVVALAWLLTRPGIAAPIASATNPEQLKDMMASVSLKLDKGDLDILNSASAY